MHEFLGHVVVDDGDIFGNRVVDLPGRGLHLGALGAHHHLHILAPQAPSRPAAVHGGVTAPKHEDPAADLAQMLEGNGGEPVNADMNVLVGLFPPGDRKIAAPGGARAHEDGVVVLFKHGAEAIHVVAKVLLDAQLEHEAHFLIEDLGR